MSGGVIPMIIGMITPVFAYVLFKIVVKLKGWNR